MAGQDEQKRRAWHVQRAIDHAVSAERARVRSEVEKLRDNSLTPNSDDYEKALDDVFRIVQERNLDE